MSSQNMKSQNMKSGMPLMEFRKITIFHGNNLFFNKMAATRYQEYQNYSYIPDI